MKKNIVSAILCQLAVCFALASGYRTLFDEMQPSWKGKVLVSANSGQVLTDNDLKRIYANHVKAIDVTDDTVRFTLRGLDVRAVESQLKPAYRAELTVNGKKCKYSKDELPYSRPKTSQYMLSDSCFYLTFDLSPQFQTVGVKTWISGFIVTEGLPEKGRKYPLTTLEYDEDEPILPWKRSMGDVATLQVVYMPACKDYFPDDSLQEDLRRKCIVLSSVAIIDGYVEIVEFKEAKGGRPASMKLRLEFNASLTGGEKGEHSSAIKVEKSEISLAQIEKTALEPMFFEMDYGWQHRYLPEDTFGAK